MSGHLTPGEAPSGKMHFLRNALAHAGKGQRQMVLAAINAAFAQESFETASVQSRLVADQLRGKLPKLAELMDGAETDVLACMTFPMARRTPIHRTNPLERPNAEIKRRIDVVGIFPNETLVTRLFDAGYADIVQGNSKGLTRQ